MVESLEAKIKKRLCMQYKHNPHEQREGDNCLSENADAEPSPAAKVRVRISAGLKSC